MLESISISRELTGQILGEVDSSIVAQIGDSGVAQIRSSHEYDHELLGVPTDKGNDSKNGLQRSSNDFELVSDGFLSRHPCSKVGSPSCLLEDDSLFPLPADLMLHFTEEDRVHNMDVTSKQDIQNKLSPRLDYISYLIHLAVFGILGTRLQILTRYLLERLFGPDGLALTGDDTPLYLDLPSNMLGSFLMVWYSRLISVIYLNIW